MGRRRRRSGTQYDDLSLGTYKYVLLCRLQTYNII
jgi:hypothetical protein